MVEVVINLEITSTTSVIHTSTDFNPSYIINVWVDFNFYPRASIQYLIYSRVGSHESVLCCILTDGICPVIQNGAPHAVTSSYKSIMRQSLPSNFDIDASTNKIISENLFIKIHPKIIACDQSIDNSTG